jgi:hypothetical protein
MKPDHNGKRELIVEQWWVGFAVLLFWAFVILAMFFGCAHAAEIKLVWNEPASGPAITEYRIYRVHPEPRVQIGVTEMTHAYVEANDGDQLVVTAANMEGESRDSTRWIVRLPFPDPVVRVTVQTSHDMRAWAEYQSFDIRESDGRFFRLRIEPAKQDP